MSLIELLIAITLLSLVMTALAASIGVSFKTVQVSRARQVAEAATNKRLEELRDVDYPQLALASMPIFDTNPENPDHFVSGSTYDYTGKGDFEQMIVETSPPGPVVHIENPATVGGTVVNIYQYVTWVDAPGIPGVQNLKRVTVVAEYHNVAIKGTSKILRESMIFTPGTVTLPATAITSTTTTTTTPSVTTTTTLPSGGCGSFSLSGGSGSVIGYTSTTTVTVTMSFPGSCGPNIYVNFSNDGTNWGPDLLYDSSNPTAAWTITGGNGTRTISARARNGVSGTTWILPEQSIILDTTRPTVAGTLTRTASCAGSTRTVTLAWGTSTDTNFVGYRLYRSTDGVTWQVVASTTSNSASNSHSKGLTSVRFYVKGYDKAGNESVETNTVSLSKNQCS